MTGQGDSKMDRIRMSRSASAGWSIDLSKTYRCSAGAPVRALQLISTDTILDGSGKPIYQGNRIRVITGQVLSPAKLWVKMIWDTNGVAIGLGEIDAGAGIDAPMLQGSHYNLVEHKEPAPMPPQKLFA